MPGKIDQLESRRLLSVLHVDPNFHRQIATAPVHQPAGATATAQGIVFTDDDGDGVIDTSETPVAGAIVFADLQPNGVLDIGEPNAVTNSIGHYSLGGLPAGQITLL